MSRVLTPADLDLAELAAVAFLSKAVNDEHGRDELDTFYKQVTENRDGPTPLARAKYSSCADLGHWWLRCIGVRADWMNRDDDGDDQKFRYGVNLNWLCPPPIGKCSIAKSKLQGNPRPGDVLVENNAHGGHVFCVLDYNILTDTLTTAEYGQPGGKMKRRLNYKATGASKLMSHIRLVDALAICSAPVDVTPIEDWDPGAVLDGLEHGT